MTPEELKARIFDLAKRNVILNQDLAAAHRNNEHLRAQLNSRPTRGQYETLAKRCDQLERQLEQQQRMAQSAAQHNRDLRKTLERVRG